MAEQQQQHGVSLDADHFRCSVCLDLLKDPVTVHCGHSYCRRCIDGCWDREEEDGVYRCPQCRESFSPRPVLRRNNMLSELMEKLKKTCGQQISSRVLLPPEPKTREDFLHYCRPLTFDVNSVSKHLSLSENNRKVTFTSNEISYPDHSDRFTGYDQVLCREDLSGRCYWEVEWKKGVRLSVAVSYKDIRRTTWESRFGYNDKSWSLEWYDHSYSFSHNNVTTEVPGPRPSRIGVYPCSSRVGVYPRPSRVGVYLDHEEGTLSFYNVSDTMTLIHKVCTTFTQPLYPGIRLVGYYRGESAELIKLW